MNVGPIQSFMIESESEADDFLTALFEKPEFRSMGEVQMSAAKYIKDARLKNYFITKAEAYLANLGSA
jgi:hypothetical protein